MNKRKKHDDYVNFVADTLMKISSGEYKIVSEEEAEEELRKEVFEKIKNHLSEKYGYTDKNSLIVMKGNKVYCTPYDRIEQFVIDFKLE